MRNRLLIRFSHCLRAQFWRFLCFTW